MCEIFKRNVRINVRDYVEGGLFVKICGASNVIVRKKGNAEWLMSDIIKRQSGEGPLLKWES